MEKEIAKKLKALVYNYPILDNHVCDYIRQIMYVKLHKLNAKFDDLDLFFEKTRKEFLKSLLLSALIEKSEKFYDEKIYANPTNHFQGKHIHDIYFKFNPHNEFIQILVGGLNDNEQSLYVKATDFDKWRVESLSLKEWENIPLPKINEITDYLAFLCYYQTLLGKYYCEIEYAVEDKIIEGLFLSQLPSKLNNAQCEALYLELLNHHFIEESSNSNFVWIFGELEKKPDDWKPIIWIKKSTKNKQLNKLSLVDLLKLIGVKKEYYTDRNKIKTAFIDNKGNPFILSNDNINGNKSNKTSEYYDILKSILEMV